MNETPICMCVSLGARQLEELSTEGIRRSRPAIGKTISSGSSLKVLSVCCVSLCNWRQDDPRANSWVG